jgi:hypothetical protein
MNHNPIFEIGSRKLIINQTITIQHAIRCLTDCQGQKSEKALGAMPKGPFIIGKHQFLDCAEFENVRCLSIQVGKEKVIFNYIVSQKSG